jgi:hypothetical protein
LAFGRGAVWVQGLPLPDYQAWLMQHDRFLNSPHLADKDVVKFSVNTENLARTIGSTEIQAEKRTIFDVKTEVLKSLDPNYSFFRQEYETAFNLLVPKVLAQLEASAPDIQLSQSSMTGSILRHNIYPSKGTAGEHTDYGILTVAHFDTPGLEIKLNGQWHQVSIRPGFHLALAGDMTERVTSGIVPSVLHRVLAPDGKKEEVKRQSNIFFIQPSKDDLIEASITFKKQNLHFFQNGTFKHFEPLRYGDWHEEKTKLAFQQTQS